jgi:hypothetical protein
MMTVEAFPRDGFVALKIPADEFPVLPPEADSYLIRFKSEEGAKNFMIAFMEAAARVFPGIADEWNGKEGAAL